MPPLTGVRVLDLSALGPGPFCSMLLADFGADVIAVERPAPPHPFDPAKSLSRGKRSVVVDLRAPGGAEVIARLADAADVLLESNRPGTMERRGLGPDVLCERNPRLIYTRLTGWGQDGPYRDRAGHDINYAAIAGTLGVIGDDRPIPPLAMLGDLAGGSLFAALGIVMAIYERTVTGRGQVIDASIADGSALLNLTNLAEFNAGIWAGRGRHILPGSAPFYGPYPCADGGSSRSAPSSPSSTRISLAPLGSTTSISPLSLIRRTGPNCAKESRRFSRPSREPTGPRCSPMSTGAEHRCSNSTNSPTTLTCGHAPQSSPRRMVR